MPNGGKDTLIRPARTINSNGQEFSLSQGFGKFGFFLSGLRQETDRRVDPPTPTIFHDHGFDYFLYGKADYILSDKEYLTINLNFGRTLTQVPFDSVEAGVLDDAQQTTNAFQTLTYYRTLSDSADRESNLLIAGYAREGGLQFTPSSSDPGSLRLFANDSTRFIVGEDRSFTTLGVRGRYETRLSHEVQIVAGSNASVTRGTEIFSFEWPNDGLVHHAILIQPSTTNYTGSDFGLFAQTELHPFEWTRLDLGVRYDQHIAPDIPFTSQISPRIKWSLDVIEGTTAYLYYGRLFMPNNIEGLRSLASRVDTTPSIGTMPERDDFYEAVLEQTFDFGLRAKAAYFLKQSAPGVDDETIGSSAVKTPVNLQHVHTEGIDLGLSYSPSESPFSAYVNTSLLHAYRTGAVSGGFLAVDASSGVADLDHDQRLSIVTSLNYKPADWFANLTAIYGSGLINANPDAEFLPGLFDFNTSGHTSPSWILNLSVGHKFYMESVEIEPSLYVTNVLDHHHLLKGAYFSGASWEEPRNIILKLGLHF
jgi:outer membrane receptor protein involved in Fe transport